MVGYTVADTPGAANAPSAVLGFSLACEDENGHFQASVFCDGVSSPRLTMQSPTKIICDVAPGGAYSAVEVEFATATESYMRVTTVHNGIGSIPAFVFHGYGGEIEDDELPQIYRHGSRYRY